MIDPIRQILDSRGFTRQQAEALLEMARESPLLLPFGVGASTWTNQPAAATPFLGRAAGTGAFPIDLRRYEQVRLVAPVLTAGTATAVLQVRLATSAPLTAASYATTLASVPLSATGFLDSGWVRVPNPSRLAGWLDLFGIDGNGTASPSLGTTAAWLR